MFKNGRLLGTVVVIAVFVVGVALGSLQSQLRAEKNFVSKDQYRVDMTRIELQLSRIETLLRDRR